ncbi:ATP-binding cassette domain-containing protein [Cellulomonas sp. WB94]|uniref:ABC transporter ATP-binding protein n=1 Tax=Cellulomonas sp. WB94 TaxID=2173174 RepID=UPI001F5B8AEC|nr:ATP-binding cassette domain-containing protein [Cellulomonas sp. WB94]
MATSIGFEHVRKVYADGTVAVDDLTLEVNEHELLALVGPSGCGKSTTLRMANRLVEPTSGRILLGGEDVTHVDAVGLRRRMGYVIQHVGLFPHRTVAQNVSTVPQLLRWDRARSRARVSELLELVGLDPDVYGRRYPHELSGGERQRVGVARALAADPPVLLMDEPFGAVDPVGRRRLQGEFRRIQRELGTTVMLVTHDVDEAVRLADRIAVLSPGGHLEQLADPVQVLAAPASPAVADLVGTDAAVRLLSLGRLLRSDLGPVTGTALVDGGAGPQPGGTAAVVVGSSLEDAFAALAGTGSGPVAVTEHGAVVGTLDAGHLLDALRRVMFDAQHSPVTSPTTAVGTLPG